MSAGDLGTFLGVFVPCASTIFGVVVFLRLGFVVGQAGVWMTLLIIVGCFVLCLLTTLSLCALISESDAVATLSHIRDPGVYCALRKSVGRSFGAMLGTSIYLAFSVDIAWYIVGFAENLQASLNAQSHIQVFPWNPPGTWVSTAIASGALAVLALVSSRVQLSTRVSLVVLVAILACIGASLFCLLWPTSDPESGSTAPSLARFYNNSWPDLTPFSSYETPTLTLSASSSIGQPRDATNCVRR